MRWSSHGQVILGGVSIHTSASRSAFPGLSLHVWDLMGRTQPGLRWDTVVRQTYSTTQIKINKQSEVFNPKHCSPPRALPCFFFPKLCFFNEYTRCSGPGHRRQLLSLGEIRSRCQNEGGENWGRKGLGEERRRAEAQRWHPGAPMKWIWSRMEGKIWAERERERERELLRRRIRCSWKTISHHLWFKKNKTGMRQGETWVAPHHTDFGLDSIQWN